MTAAGHGSQHPDPHPDAERIELANDRDAIDDVENTIISLADTHGYSQSAQFALRLAIEEAVVNAFKHGHRDLPEHLTVSIEYFVNSERIFVAVEDQGPGFTPSDVPDPTLDENLELPSGRGLVLMQAYMTRVEYVGRGNRVEMELIRAELPEA
ncbi:MAG: ATP-binding protein [Planctomycetota bacterium]